MSQGSARTPSHPPRIQSSSWSLPVSSILAGFTVPCMLHARAPRILGMIWGASQRPLRGLVPCQAPPHFGAALACPGATASYEGVASILPALGVKPTAQAEVCSSLVRFSKELLPAHLQALCCAPSTWGPYGPEGQARRRPGMASCAQAFG